MIRDRKSMGSKSRAVQPVTVYIRYMYRCIFTIVHTVYTIEATERKKTNLRKIRKISETERFSQRKPGSQAPELQFPARRSNR